MIRNLLLIFLVLFCSNCGLDNKKYNSRYVGLWKTILEPGTDMEKLCYLEFTETQANLWAEHAGYLPSYSYELKESIFQFKKKNGEEFEYGKIILLNCDSLIIDKEVPLKFARTTSDKFKVESGEGKGWLE